MHILSPYFRRIQRAWRASMSRRGNGQGQGGNHTSHHQGELVPSEGLQDPVVTTNISPVRPYEEKQTEDYMVHHEAGGERSRHL